MPTISINNTNIHYKLEGNTAGSPVIAFFNGSLSTISSWDKQMPIADFLDARILRHDFRGQLMSDMTSKRITFEDHSDDFKALLDYLKIDKVHLVGISYGGIAAMKFAIRYPYNLKTLILIDTLSESNHMLDTIVHNFIFWARQAIGNADMKEQFFWNLLPFIHSRDYVCKNWKSINERAKTFSKIPDEYFNSAALIFENQLRTLSITDKIKEIRTPTQVIFSSEDNLTPGELSDAIFKAVPDCEYLKIPGSGHSPTLEKSEELNTIISGFISKRILE